MSKRSFGLGAVLLALAGFGLFWFRPRPEVRPIVISTGLKTRAESIAFSPDSKTLAIGVSMFHGRPGLPTGEVQLRDAATGSLQTTLPMRYGVSATFSPDGNSLAITGATVKLWDLKQARFIPFSKGAPVGYSIIFSSDGKMMATGCWDTKDMTKFGSSHRKVKLWNAATGQLLRTLNAHVTAPVAFSPDGRTLAAGSYPEGVQVWDVPTGKLKYAVPAKWSHVISDVAFSPDGRIIASGDGTEAHLMDAETGRLLTTLTPPSKRVFALAFSPDGKTLATGGPHFHRKWFWQNRDSGPHGQSSQPVQRDSTGEICLWDVASGSLTRTLTSGHWVLSVIWSPDGKTLASMSDDDTVRLWRLP